MTYHFYLNEETDAEGRHIGMCDGWAAGHKMVLAHSGTIDAATDAEALNMLFEIFNINHPRDYRNRSMSVGDTVVLLDTITPLSRAYSCERIGWKLIEPATK